MQRRSTHEGHWRKGENFLMGRSVLPCREGGFPCRESEKGGTEMRRVRENGEAQRVRSATPLEDALETFPAQAAVCNPPRLEKAHNKKQQ